MGINFKYLVAAIIVGAIVAGAAGIVIGTMRISWTVTTPPPPPPPPPQPSASMEPSEISLDLGTIYVGEEKTVSFGKVATLKVENGPVDVTFTLEGNIAGFDEFIVKIRLMQDGNVVREAVIRPTIVVSDVMHPSPTGAGGWSDKEASKKGEVVACFIRPIQGEGDVALLVPWKPGASIDIDNDGTPDYEYPNTPFGYTYDPTIPETGCIFINDNDSGEAIQLVVVYPPVSATIPDVEPGTYEIYVEVHVKAGNVPMSGEAKLTVSYSA